jgi:hypothetical protein
MHPLIPPPLVARQLILLDRNSNGIPPSFLLGQLSERFYVGRIWQNTQHQFLSPIMLILILRN